MAPIAAKAGPRETQGILCDWARRSFAISLALTAVCSQAARADEGGVSFWLPGFYGSLAAAPQVPGFSYTNIYYHTTVSAGADVAFARQVPIGHLTVPFTGQVNANLNADANLGRAYGAFGRHYDSSKKHDVR